MRRLIVNADDFGLTLGVNRAILEASRSGVVTSATLMANAGAFEEAVDMARREAEANTGFSKAATKPGLKVGCHVVLIDGEPLCDGLPSITVPASNARGRRFFSTWREFAQAVRHEDFSPDEIQREATAQIRKIQASGVTLTHVDTHKHAHMFPRILLPVLRAAKECGVYAVRNPFEPRSAWLRGVKWSAPLSWPRAAMFALLQRFALPFITISGEEGMFTPDGAVGVAATGNLDQQRLTNILRGLPAGTWELVCHPGYSDAALKATGTRLLGSRQTELEILTSMETKQALAEGEIELISYADMQ